MPQVLIFADLRVEQKQDINTRALGWQLGDDGDVLQHSVSTEPRSQTLHME